MFSHLVMFDLHDPAETQRVIGILESMRGQITELSEIRAVADETRSERCADVLLFTHFADRDAYEVYATHPVHVAVLAQLKPLIERAIVVDFTD